MPIVQPLDLPEDLLQKILGGTKTRELHEIQFISAIRPDPHDLDDIRAVSVIVRLWAADANDALTQLKANPQYVRVGKQELELEIKVLVSAGPVPVQGVGITEDS